MDEQQSFLNGCRYALDELIDKLQEFDNLFGQYLDNAGVNGNDFGAELLYFRQSNQDNIDEVIQGLKDKKEYLDDVIITSEIIEEGE